MLMSFCKHPLPSFANTPPTTLPPHNTLPRPSPTPQTLTSVHSPATPALLPCIPAATPCSPPRHPHRYPLPTRSPSPQLPRPTLRSDRGGFGAASRGGAGERSRPATASRVELCAGESSRPAPAGCRSGMRRARWRKKADMRRDLRSGAAAEKADPSSPPPPLPLLLLASPAQEPLLAARGSGGQAVANTTALSLRPCLLMEGGSTVCHPQAAWICSSDPIR
jgi:hypothetical protein